MQFNKSKVEYASHQLALWYGKCPGGCIYCWVDYLFRKRGIEWACGELRVNEKALDQALEANKSNVKCLVVSFASDPLPHSSDPSEKISRLNYLKKILNTLERRQIPTKVLTKNYQIGQLIREVPQPYKHIQIGMSITTNIGNETKSKFFEPYSVSPAFRFGALATLEAHGFRTWASVEPILPYTNVDKLLLQLYAINIEECWIGQGKYLPALKTAFNWRELAFKVYHYDYYHPATKFHLKSELSRFVNAKPVVLDEYFGKNHV